MCRLLGLNAGRHPVSASFWLIDAPDSLEAQSHRNVDGSGIGFFDSSGAPVVDKQPEPAFDDEEFRREAKQARSVTFVAHVRYATAGNRTLANTHPFTMGGRIIAILTMIVGIGIFGTFISLVGSSFLTTMRENPPGDETRQKSKRRQPPGDADYGEDDAPWARSSLAEG